MASERETWMRVGDWCLRPTAATISRDGKTQRVEARTMGVLLVLASHPGKVVSSDELLATVWPDVTVSQDSVYQAVASLRRLLGDDPKEPAYIATVPRLGYRMVASWGVVPFGGGGGPPMPPPDARRRRAAVMAGVTALVLLFTASVWFFGRTAVRNAAKVAANAPATTAPVPVAAARAEKSIAVLPFIDLTDKMNHEIFVDGMTEELVDKLSKVPGLHVPPARTSLAFKGKHPTIAGVAKTLGTTYVLDGSVRNSGKTLRVEAQLVRADSGFVVWSETYDRPSGDLVKIEDDIAAEVTRSLAAMASR
jgi:TolB-like protein/DNA-binding winged helix-turn-helix (wHTH) protein